jgi:hypothetical protein
MKYLIVDNGKQHIIECEGFKPAYPILWSGKELEGKVAETLVVKDGALSVDAAKAKEIAAAEAQAKVNGEKALTEKKKLYAAIRDFNALKATPEETAIFLAGVQTILLQLAAQE